MKTIGLIGGMSWESSVEYYRILNEEVKQKLGGLHSAQCILYSVDFEEIEILQRNGEWMKAAEILGEVAHRLECAGADFIILCTNTMHKVSEQIQARIQIPFLHIAEVVARNILAHGIKTVGLLGTRYTMEQDFYIKPLKAQGIEVIIPKEGDRNLINTVIFDELCLGNIVEESKVKYQRIIEDLVTRGAEGIVLGCTEIGSLIGPTDSPVPIFDTTLLHAQYAVDFALLNSK